MTESAKIKSTCYKYIKLKCTGVFKMMPVSTVHIKFPLHRLQCWEQELWSIFTLLWKFEMTRILVYTCKCAGFVILAAYGSWITRSNFMIKACKYIQLPTHLWQCRKLYTENSYSASCGHIKELEDFEAAKILWAPAALRQIFKYL